MEFAIAPLSGYALGGPRTWAAFFKRSALSTDDIIVDVTTAALADRAMMWASAGNTANYFQGSNANSAISVSSTSIWYLLVVTAPVSSIARFHLHDGTSWTHSTPATGGAGVFTVAGTDRLWIAPGSTGPFGGDIVCVGFKKSDSTDLQVETLSRTLFSAWASFGFDWLIGYETAATQTNRTTPGSGDEIARSGTSLVADPPSWSWTVATTPVADFTGTPLTGLAPLSVAFTNLSTG